MGRSPSGAPVLGEKGFKRVGGGWISLECCTHAARWQSISCYRPEGTVESCARDRTATPGLEPWRFRDAFGATWGAPIRVPGGGRKHSEEQQVGRTVSAYHSRGGTYIAKSVIRVHSQPLIPKATRGVDGQPSGRFVSAPLCKPPTAVGWRKAHPISAKRVRGHFCRPQFTYGRRRPRSPSGEPGINQALKTMFPPPRASTSAAPSSIDDGCGSPWPALPIQEFDWVNSCCPPMPIRTTFRLVDWGGRYGPSRVDSCVRFRRARRSFPGFESKGAYLAGSDTGVSGPGIAARTRARRKRSEKLPKPADLDPAAAGEGTSPCDRASCFTANADVLARQDGICACAIRSIKLRLRHRSICPHRPTTPCPGMGHDADAAARACQHLRAAAGTESTVSAPAGLVPLRLPCNHSRP